MSRHFSSPDLLAYLDGNDAVVDVEAVREHVTVCGECATRLVGVQADHRQISDPEVWVDLDDAGTPPGTSEFTTLCRQMQEDARRAEALLHDLQQHPLETWIEHLAGITDGCAGALIRQVTAHARDVEERQPKHALELLAMAETIANLATDSADALGETWKERANVLMILGDYPGALNALDRAESILAAGAVAPFDLAFVTWGRASIYFEMGEYARALKLAREVVPVFRRFGDSLRAAQIQVLEAGVLYEQGDVDSARTIWLSLLPIVERLGDRLTLARVYANIACCHLQRYELPDTEAWVTRANQIYSEFGHETEITRTRWALAKVLVRRGDSDTGIAALERVAVEFSAAGLDTDAAEVRLDIVDEMLRRGRFARATWIAKHLVKTFVDAGARISVVRALASLHEAAEGLKATPALVRAVRHVLSHPEQPFPAPPDNRNA